MTGEPDYSQLSTHILTRCVKPFRLALTKGIQHAYDQAITDSDAFDEPERFDLHGDHRRGRSEAESRGVCRRFASYGIGFEMRRHPSNGQSFLAIQCGNVLLTLSKTSGPRALPKDAHFRNQFSWTRNLWDDLEDRPGPNSPIYGLVTHGADRYRSGPKWVEIIVPDRHNARIDFRLDLLAELQEHERTSQEVQRPDDQAAPRVRRRKRQEDA